jgi:parallel beta-helix repeat protein
MLPHTFTLLVHRDVDAHLSELDVSIRESVRQKVIWAETQLAMTGRATRVKGTRAQVWRRTPVRGNQYYLWWAPADTLDAAFPDLDRAVIIRDLRHHDLLDVPAPAEPQDYHVVHPRELDPRSLLQASVARDAMPSGVAARFVRGQPGTGKTVTLLYAARDLAASKRVLYVTYTRRLAEEALYFARANGIEAELDVVTLSGLEGTILGDATGAPPPSPALLAERFEGLIRSIDASVVGPWLGKGHSLWAEARSSLIGMALPFAWRRGALAIPACEMLDRDLYRKVSGLDEDAADRAHHVAEIAVRRGLLADQTRARVALDALLRGEHGGLDLTRTGAVLVDEVQDLTPVEIALLLEVARAMAKRNHSMLFVAAGDASQTVHPSGFEWGVAKDLVHQRLDREPIDVVLRQPMRNARAVASLVDKTGALYKLLSKELRPGGDTPDEAPAEVAEPGRVLRCEPPDEAAWQALLGALVATPGKALVTLGQSSASSDARTAASEISFTPAEIKGLERRTVAITGLHDVLGTLSRLTTRAEQEGRFLDGLEARHLVDGVRVALSRATEMLILLGPTLSGTHAAALDLMSDVETVEWNDLLEMLGEDDLTDAERARGFLEEAREHAERGDTRRAIERLERAEGIAQRLGDPALSAAAREVRARIDAKVRPRVVVAPTGGDFTSLQAAIDAVPDGATLVVRAGTYEGPFSILERQIEILGDGAREAIVLESTAEMVLLAVGGDVTLENVTIVLRDGTGKLSTRVVASLVKGARPMKKAMGIEIGDFSDATVAAASQAGVLGSAVSVMKGKLRMRGCDIAAGGGTGMLAGLDGRLHVESCRVHDGFSGVIAGPQGHLIITGSDVFDNTTGLVLAKGSDATVRETFVRNAVKDGILVQEGTVALIEKSDVSLAKGSAIHVEKGATPIVRGNRIHHGGNSGIHIAPGGGGLFEDNDIFENAPMGLWIGAAAAPTVRNNRISKSLRSGIVVGPKGGGIFEGNEIFENKEMGFVSAEDADVTVKGSTIRANGSYGIYVQPGGSGTFEGNDVYANRTQSGILVGARACPVLRKNRVHHHEQVGVIINGGAGELEGNEIFENGQTGLHLQNDACPLVRGNRIHHNEVGIFVTLSSAGTFEDNDVYEQKILGVRVSVNSSPVFRTNRIRKTGKFCVYVSEEARPTFEDNDISDAADAAVAVSGAASPTFLRNRIHHSARGIDCLDRALGLFEGNDIFSNGTAGMVARGGAAPPVRSNRIRDSKESGVLVQFADGLFEGNEIFGNRGVGLRAESQHVVVAGNRIHDNADGGVFIQPKCTGLFERNDVANNKKCGICVAEQGDPMVRNNRVHGSPLGIIVCKRARGTYTANDVRGNARLGLLIDVDSEPVSCEGNITDAAAPLPRGAGGKNRRKSGRRR